MTLKTLAARDQALTACRETTAIDTRPAAYAAACEAAAKVLGCRADDDEAVEIGKWAMDNTLGR